MSNQGRNSKPPFDVFEHYRTLTQQLIARCSVLGTTFDHGTTKGNAAEKIVRDFLRQFFPSQIRVETGQIVSYNGVRSPQTDVILFSDVPGSVVGVDEGGVFLVRSEAVRCVVEVKKSLIKPTIGELQDHSRRLADTMKLGERRNSWTHWSIAVQSSIVRDKILAHLKETWAPSSTTGGLLVLDAPMSGSEVRQSLVEEELISGEYEQSKTIKLTDKQLIAAVAALKSPNSVFLVRDKNEKYLIHGDRSDALLKFMILLEQTTRNSETCSAMCLKDFLDNGSPLLDSDET